MCLQNELDHPPPPNKLFVLQGIIAPTTFSVFEGSLQDWVVSFNGIITCWFAGPRADRNLNILMVDWVEFGDVIGKAIWLNQQAKA